MRLTAHKAYSSAVAPFSPFAAVGARILLDGIVYEGEQKMPQRWEIGRERFLLLTHLHPKKRMAVVHALNNFRSQNCTNVSRVFRGRK